MDLIEICNLVAKFGSTMATALSEAGSEYTELVRAEGGRAIVTAERQAEILAQTLGSKILRAANQYRLAADVAGMDPNARALVANLADEFAAKAISLTGNAATAESRIATVAAEAQDALQVVSSKWGGALGVVGQSAGIVIDTALMLEGAWELGTTGNGDKLGEACGGMIMAWAGGLALGAVASALSIPTLAIGIAAGMGAAGGSLLGKTFYNLLKTAGNFYFDMLLGDKSGVSDLTSEIKDLFDTAETTKSPLILDLDGDGVETLALSAGIHFDHDGNRFAELTGWAGADDGLLVWDRNGNGAIDDGSELFGNKTLLSDGATAANGFAALADLDTNLDGIIDSNDASFDQLMVWKDGDSNGVVSAGELLTLADAGVASLITGYTAQNVTDDQGNAHLQAGQYIGIDGNTHTMDDVWFANDTAQTVDLDVVEVDETIAALPDIQGFGSVHSLHQAMAHDVDGELQNLVQEYADENDATARREILTQLIYVWAGVEDIDPESRAASQIYGNVIGDARKLATLEAFLGESYVGVWCWGELDPNPHGQAAPFLLEAFDKLADYVDAQLMVQTHLAPLLNSIQLGWNETSQTFGFDVTATAALLHDAYSEDVDDGMAELAEFASALKTFGDLGQQLLSLLREQGDFGGDEFSCSLAAIGYQVLNGDAGNNVLQGSAEDELIMGKAGDDNLSGNAGNDKLIGGTGNDTLYGGNGDDIFVFNLGDGQDVIVNDEVAGVNTLAFGEGITLASLQLVRSGDDLLLRVGSDGDQLTLKGWYATDVNRSNWTGYRLDTISFADGSSMSTGGLIAQMAVHGSEGDDILNGYYGSNGGRYGTSLAENDWFSGGTGNDTLFGDTGEDKLDGGLGDDILKGGEGNDKLIGGTGNDTLYGGNGDDIFVFNLGDGQDVIVNDEVAGVNTLAFGEGITLASLQLVRSGDDLLLRVGTDGDQLTLKGWYATDVNRSNWTGYRLDTISFADGSSMSTGELIAQMAVHGSEGDDILNGYYGSNGGRYGTSLAENDWFSGGTGNDTLFGDTGEDKLDGGSGDDILKGGEGNDKLIGGTGNDTLYGGNGDDIFVFNLGDGQDVIVNDEVAGVNTLAFGEGITLASLQLVRSGDDLLLRVGSDGDQLTLKGWYATDVNRSNWTGYRLDTISFADGSSMSTGGLIAQMAVHGSEGDDILNGYYGSNGGRYGTSLAENDWFSGGTGNDTLFGDTGEDKLDGGSGDDILKGGEGNDKLIGGTGNDTLYGGNGDDIFVFNLGDGQDVIVNDEVAGVNTLAFGEGITLASLQLVRSGDDLLLRVGTDGDQLTLKGWYATDVNRSNWTGYRLDTISFADGSSMSTGGLIAQMAVHGSEGDDILNGYYGSNGGRYGTSLAENDWFSGGTGNDTLFGDTGEDKLDGGSGDDILKGGEGNDKLIGGTGNDTLYGGNGDDIFVFNLGDGQDVIVNDEVAGVNTLAFGEGITLASLQLVRSGDDLLLRVGSDGDQLTLKGWYATDVNRSNWTGYRLDTISFADGSSMSTGGLIAQMAVHGSEGDDILNGYYGSNGGRYGTSLAENDWFSGGTGNDTLFGDTGEDKLDGGSGDDILKGGEGNDKLIGGTGNDTLYGGNGDDIFVFNLGDGQDVIVNDEVAGVNTLAFGEGITLASLQLVRSGDDLLLRVGTDGDQLTLKGWYATDVNRSNWTGYRLDTISFADGSSMSTGGLIAQMAVHGSEGDDILNGYYGSNGGRYGTSLAENDWFSGGAGNDTLFGDTGEDKLDGGSGDDILKGGEGNDKLIGGTGNDTLYGGNGDDTFVFNLGDGQDVIVNDEVAGVNTLAFGEGITLASLQLVRSGDDLLLRVGSDGDQLTLKGWYATDANRSNWTGYRLDTISFADGSSMSTGGLIAQMAVHGSEGDDILNGYYGSNGGRYGTSLAENDWFSGGTGNDTLFGDTGEDKLDGGLGDDILKGGEGNDKLIGGTGNDTLYGGNGDDIFVFNLGDGQDVIVNDEVAGVNTLAFGEGITLASLQLVRSGDDLLLRVGTDGDQLTLKGWYATDVNRSNWTGYRLDTISFADGSSMSTGELIAQMAVHGSEGDDILNGYYGSNGGRYGTSLAENDWFSGGAGNDTLFGDTGEDKLDGGSGDDILKGGEGNDKLIGGTGNDTLYGGNGSDSFVFDTALDTVTNIDTLVDFVINQDSIHLDRNIFTSLIEEGTLNSSLFCANCTGLAQDDNDYILYNTSSGALLYDADGNGEGAAVQFASLSNKPEISANDFLVVA